MRQHNVQEVSPVDFVAGGGEMGARMRAFDWSRTPLGPLADWPRSLKIAIRIMLSSRYAMWMSWGPELTFFCNDAYLPTVGVKESWVLGAPSKKVWEEIWPDIGPRIETVIRTGQATYDEELLLFLERHGYPEETYHTFSYSPLPDDDGRIGGHLCVVVEDTKRVIGERRLRVLRDIGARITAARNSAELFTAVETGLSADVEDAPFFLLYMLEDEGTLARLVARGGLGFGSPAAPRLIDAKNGGPWPFTGIVGGAPVVIEDLGAKLRDELPSAPWDRQPQRALVLPIAQQGQSEPAGALIVGLTFHRPFDDDYSGYLNLLAGQIAAKWADLRAYEEARKQAEALAEIDRAKTTFFSNASHEFRTPLTLMLSPLEDLLARAKNDNAINVGRSELDLVHRNGLRLLKLVNTLLDFSRIEAGRVDSVFEPTDIAAYTAELASSFRSAMERAGLSFTVDCAPIAQPVYVDRDMWEKIVLNLVSNAFKYTLKGGVTVRLAATPPAGDRVELRVEDTGVGIPPAELAKVFDRFHRIQGQPGRTQEGTGIGLALVQELARLHGGSVAVESASGQGAAFTVTIPTGRAHLPADRVGVSRSEVSSSVRAAAFVAEAMRWLPGEAAEPMVQNELIEDRTVDAAGSDRSYVILADDNLDMRNYVRRLLRARYDVEPVGDGRAALEAARKHRPDLILTDVMMPRLDGFGLLQAVRADADLRDIPVILLSARAGEEAKVEGLDAGADDYLIKPFSARELLARVSANLELARERRKAADVLREESSRLEVLQRTGAAIAAELNLEELVQKVTDACVELTGAQFGAFFYNLIDDKGESYTLYTLSGAPREAFSKFPMPRNTKVFDPTFKGEGVVRSDNIRKDPRYGQNPPYNGQPKGHLPVVSYLAVPVVSRSGAVHGGLFFGHAEEARFTERHELIVSGIAAQSAVAIDNANLYREARNAHAELKRLNESLEQRVTQEIKARLSAEEALRQAQKMEAIGQLTGGIAHDFNNTLQVIMGNLETLRRRTADTDPAGEVKGYVASAIRGAQRAATLTGQLLAFSRRQALQPSTIDLGKMIVTMSELLRRTLGEQVSIETVLAGGLWKVSADPNQLESAILNLAVNGRDAMPDGGKLTIETANVYLDDDYSQQHGEIAPGQYVVIAVSDSGVGMSRETIEKAFEPFFTTKEIGKGTGLGLSQVYGFVKQSGGHVKIYSELGQGTTVKIYLPRLRSAEEPASAAIHEQPVAFADNGDVILLVEDDDEVRAYTSAILRELRYAVIEAADGVAALDILERRKDIKLLFTDVGLPKGMNGRQLADEAQRRRPDLKVLFTTGYARNAIVHHGRLDPGVEMIPKPFTYSTVAAKIRRILDR